ncbi:hypothetical protein SODALDRAFT_323952 [Sodiomyces alkalinus F11]|uniref:RRM domain-containing protein n=1 Tax=Sodiomyces alkalinus (strain CBS 110278 / VKM F-3762 / F11) TaxID=1314773 RepID=A0A3N2PVE9_SODAK|nr:hypothetical protein SODALDRAFT_323952 [Sodiomyces alkalinus F11]ROT38479.1 hypothetical protein SODALDRAFT_323952 [Sodiomyces alkalinus F11]
MAPKKKETQKMSLGDFLSDGNLGGSWADEVEDTYGTGTQPLPAPERRSGYGSGYGSGSGAGYGSNQAWGSSDRNYAPRDAGPAQIPDKPPYTAHLGNLSYDATVDAVTDFFTGCDIISVRIIEDREQQRPKGFAYAEFANVEGLKAALQLDGETFQGRSIRVKVADPPRGGDRGESSRDFSDWSRKGPLPDLPSRGGNDRRPSEFGERRSREPADDGRVRDFGNWERKGPLPPPERPATSRDGSHPPAAEGRSESFRGGRRESPAAWGEGQGPARHDGSRPPRGDRPERVPTAAEKDMQWRSNMRPTPPARASPAQSRDGSEAPTSPAPAGATLAAPAPAGRPKLNLQKRTVSEATDVVSPSLTGDAKSSPFGAARPIDTAQREREVEERRQQQIKAKREADEKAKEERRLAKEAAAKEAAEKAEEEAKAAEKAAEKAEEEAKAAEKAEEEAAAAAAAAPKPADVAEEAPQPAQEAGPEGEEKTGEAAKDTQNGAAAGAAAQKVPVRSRGGREGAPPIKTRAAESGNWRQSSGELRSPRGHGPPGPRRGGGAPRGSRYEGGGSGRGSRANGSQGGQQPATPTTAEPGTPVQEEDGWTTVSVNKGRRGARA